MEAETTNEDIVNIVTVSAEVNQRIAESERHPETLKNHAQFISDIAQFFNEPAMSDVTICIGDQIYHGHKFVLAKSSDVFQTMLYGKPWLPDRNTSGSSQSSSSNRVNVDTLALTETEDCAAVFGIFLRYLYTAEVDITNDCAVGVLCLADKYNVNSLKNLCVSYMKRNAASPCCHNALHWYAWAKQLSLPTLVNRCFKTINWNMEEIMTLPDWLDLDIDFMEDILVSSEIVINDEFTLLEGVRNWLEVEFRQESFAVNAKRLLPLIRFPMMNVNQLYFLESSPDSIARNEGCGKEVLELIGKAYRFRALCPSQYDLEINFSNDFYQPRDYLDLAVDNVRIGNTIRFGFQVDVRMYHGPVPNIERTGEWKLTYRKNQETWSLQIYCHESAMVHNEARCQATICVFNDAEKIVQVERTPVYACTRGTQQIFQFDLLNPDEAKSLSVILKPLAH